ncbi:MAG: NAD-dependent epimerase/dehydratase family protein [Chitinophagia bacterium]|nr:NAD-dependent epimerase/dehydratase family protein [Chitinophagia bacterium]
MNYVITGSTGHISKPLTEQLLSAGHQVTVISSNAEKKALIEQMGATAAIGDVSDIAFLTATFRGADAVYTMVPPTWAAADWKAHIHSIGNNYAEAIKAAGVNKVVNLSSIGAHMPDGCGPVSGLYHAEAALNQLEGVDVRHLRPGFFYYNFYGNLGMVRHMGIIGGNYGEGTTMVLAHTNDIAQAAAEELLHNNYTGKTVRYIASDERTTAEIASVLGTAIGKPELPWVNFKDEDALNGMVQAGMPAGVAANYVEMGQAMASGKMAEDYQLHRPALAQTRLEQFAAEFAAAYAAA